MVTMDESTPFLPNKQEPTYWNKLKQKSMLIRTTLVLGLLASLVCGVWALQLHNNNNGGHPHHPTWGQDLADLEAASQACLSTIDRVDGDHYVQRQHQLATTMKQEGVFAYIMEPSAAMLYYTNMTWSRTERAFLVVFTLSGQDNTLDMTIVTPLFEETRAKEQWVKANLPTSVVATMVSWVEHGSPFTTVLQVLLGHGYDKDTSGAIHIEPTTRFFIAEGIRAQLTPQAVAVASDPIQRLRMVKTKQELDIMRCANQLTERAIRVVKAHVVVGMAEPEIEAKMLEALGVAGLINTWVVALVDDNAAFPHGQPGKTNRVGATSLVLIDTGGELYDYQSDTTRTFFMGNKQKDDDDDAATALVNGGGGGGSNKTIQAAWWTVRQAQEAVLTQMRQGHTCAQVDLTARAVIEEAGWGDYFTHRLGHGIGLEMHEDPYMNQGNTHCILQPGFTFSVEPGIYVPHEFGIRLEDIVVVNQDGHLELLTKGLAGDPWTLEF